ncbi:hypothetical protein [Blastococcus xanthinilyticus]|uniref:Uncharacterized protein n=1 Tax=Blastococcus xanthinilyticus TaxID=1564164 RepID=A0A5S5CLI8_9ACTN|nr:hypothetical protein [Blastococcus xanthinilyticus]TYP82048.1 hypothetical protein BD833_12032 [Blastococcus xanthinilyticus]
MTASEPLAMLDELEQALAAATPGPWLTDTNGCCVMGGKENVEFVTNRSTTPADAAAIVAAVNTAPKLLAAVRGMYALADLLEDSVLLDKETRFRAAAEIRAVLDQAIGGDQ